MIGHRDRRDGGSRGPTRRRVAVLLASALTVAVGLSGCGDDPADADADRARAIAIVQAQLGQRLPAWTARFRDEAAGGQSELVWSSQQGDGGGWSVALVVNRSNGPSRSALWGTNASLDAAEAAASTSPTTPGAPPPQPMRALDEGARQMRVYPAPEPVDTGEFSFVATTMGIKRGTGQLQVALLGTDDPRVGKQVTVGGKLDNALLRGLVVPGRHGELPTFSNVELDGTRFVDRAAGRDQRVSRSTFVRRLASAESPPIVITWPDRGKGLEPFGALLATPPAEIATLTQEPVAR